MIDNKALKEAMDARGLKASWLAEKIGLTDTQISNRLNGRIPFKLNEYLAIVKILKLSKEERAKIEKA